MKSYDFFFYTGEWAFISGHTIVKGEGSGDSIPAPLPLSSDHQQYYQTLFTVIAGPSNDLFKVSIYVIAATVLSVIHHLMICFKNRNHIYSW